MFIYCLNQKIKFTWVILHAIWENAKTHRVFHRKQTFNVILLLWNYAFRNKSHTIDICTTTTLHIFSKFYWKSFGTEVLLQSKYSFEFIENLLMYSSVKNKSNLPGIGRFIHDVIFFDTFEGYFPRYFNSIWTYKHDGNVLRRLTGRRAPCLNK